MSRMSGNNKCLVLRYKYAGYQIYKYAGYQISNKKESLTYPKRNCINTIERPAKGHSW